jgi:hypothetical protein
MASDPRQRFDVKTIIAALSELGIDAEGAYLDDEFRGGQCHVFKINAPKNISLAVRVPLYMGSSECSDAKVEALKTELRILKTLEAKEFPWAPRCLGESLTFDNSVQHPFLVLSWIDGAALVWSEENPPRSVRDKVLAQLATIQLALVECTLETGAWYNYASSNCADGLDEALQR